VAGLAAVERLRAQDPALVNSCSACAGLSLGEYTALVFAGAMSFEDGLKVRKRVSTSA
jgi:[acyl-carrier-protein] S-malonyltransferase